MLDVTSIEVRSLLRYCAEVSSPVAYKASCLLASGNWDDLVRMKVSPDQYMSAGRYLEDLQVVSLLKKHPGVRVTVDPKEAALASFFKAESLCYWNNERLNPLLHDSRHYGERMHEFVRAWRKEVRRVLGRVPSMGDLRPRFGPGSTYNNVGDEITVIEKLSTDISATSLVSATWESYFDTTSWSRHAACGILSPETVSDINTVFDQALTHSTTFGIRSIYRVPGNRFTTVPKTALTDRGICIEPSLNVFLQLGVGERIADRLGYCYGWYKSNIQQYHRWLARVGSLTGAVATIDLSSASDSICKNLVKLLLPPGWYDLLYRLRSPRTFVDGRWVRIEKFSSMGNGYTFELETLLFYTLCKVIAREGRDRVDWVAPGVDVSVFGDDIIVPSTLAVEVVSALKFFGFEVNQDKTFLSGPFRESCGGDYYRGFDVRPHFQKLETKEPHELIAFRNGVSRARRRLGDAHGRWGSLHSVCGLIENQIPRKIRLCRGPESLGDLVLNDDNLLRWSTVTRSSIRYIRVWRPVANRKRDFDHYRPGVQMAYALYGWKPCVYRSSWHRSRFHSYEWFHPANPR